MIKGLKKPIGIILCIVLIVSAIAGCTKKMTFSALTLDEGTVGIEYMQSVATIEEDADITYTLKEGSSLPLGLYLEADGMIIGVPEEKADNLGFTIVASAEKYTTVETEFRITIKTGTITYEGNSEVRAAHNKENNISIATALGAGGEVSYSLKSGTLPAGLQLNQDGTITGIASSLGEEKTFVVTASSNDCTPMDAEFTINVILPWLELKNATLPTGKVSQFYEATVAKATGTDAEDISYSLKAGSTLPTGLELESTGDISGVPQAQISRHKATVVASASGFTSAEAVFTITIQSGGSVSTTEGVITWSSSASRTVPEAYIGETYNESRILAVASASNRNPVSYYLDDGSTLPEGFIVQPNGTLRTSGSTRVIAPANTFTFRVRAEAENCTASTAEFTLSVLPAKLIYNATTLSMATVNTLYNASVDHAEAPDNGTPTITYSLKEGVTMPAGLTVNAQGIVSGTPTKSSKRAYFIVIASAEGYSSREAEIFIRIQEEIKTVSNGVFEAEYFDLTGIVGGGYSGSASEDQMIQSGTQYSASNDYFIGFTHSEISFTLNFNSSSAVNGVTLKLRLASEIGSITLTPSVYDIILNGTSLPYGSVNVSGAGQNMGNFQDVTISSISLVSGANSIVLAIKTNTLLQGSRTGGPAIDCVKLENFGSAVLTWRPVTYNLDRFQA